MSLLNKASLIMTPNAVKQSKVYSIIPSNGNGDFTFTRGSLATQKNSSGIIEATPYNLLTYSEDFSNTVWIKGNASINSNIIIAPNLTLTADKLVEDTANSSHRTFEPITVNISTNTLSIYAKANERNWIRLGFFDGITSKGSFFNLNNGTIGTNTATNATITNVGNGWYRCTITLGSTTINGQFQISLAQSDNITVYQGDGTSSIYIWGAQLVQGSIPRDYFYTTDRLNVPRLNYDTLGGCPSLLLEPQRTNLLLNSATVVTQTIATTAVATTVSFYGTGTITFTGSYVGSLVGTGANNRVTITFTPTVGSLILTVVGSCTKGQLEVGAYPTTYIPTTTGTVTRVVDTMSRNNIYTNGLITSAGGTWFVELNNNILYTRDVGTSSFNISDVSVSAINGFSIRTLNSLERLSIYKYILGSGTQIYLTTTNEVKIAIKWNGTTADIFVNGVKVVSATSFTATNMEFLNGGAQDVPKYIKSMMLFPTPLTDTECIQLTTL